MNGTLPTTPAIDAYVGRCAPFLADLPNDTRQSMLSDIRQMVTEVSVELDGDPSDLLDPPERFVADLRAAAGFPLERSTRPRRVPTIWTRPAKRALSSILTALGALSPLARELRPAGWVLRGYAVAAAVSYLFAGHADIAWWAGFLPVPRLFGTGFLGALWTGLAIAISVRVGRAAWSGWRRAVVLATSIVATLASLAIADDIVSTSPPNHRPAVIVYDAGGVPDVAEPIVMYADGFQREVVLQSIGHAMDVWELFAEYDPPIRLLVGGELIDVNDPQDLFEVLLSAGLPR